MPLFNQLSTVRARAVRMPHGETGRRMLWTSGLPGWYAYTCDKSHHDQLYIVHTSRWVMCIDLCSIDVLFHKCALHKQQIRVQTTTMLLQYKPMPYMYVYLRQVIFFQDFCLKYVSLFRNQKFDALACVFAITPLPSRCCIVHVHVAVPTNITILTTAIRNIFYVWNCILSTNLPKFCSSDSISWISDNCFYKNRTYGQGETWRDGCDYDCRCEDSTRGYYRCTSVSVYHRCISNNYNNSIGGCISSICCKNSIFGCKRQYLWL